MTWTSFQKSIKYVCLGLFIDSSITMSYISILMSMPYHLLYCSFTVSLLSLYYLSEWQVSQIIFATLAFLPFYMKWQGPTWWLKQWRIFLQCRRQGFDPWVRKITWRRQWLPTPVFLPREFHGQKGLAGYSPWRRSQT